MFPLTPRNLLIAVCLLILGGCSYLPEISRQPTVFNPFPQLTKVAVVPFFNLSTEPSADGRQFATAYAAELQSVPGFEVVPVGVAGGVRFVNDSTATNIEAALTAIESFGTGVVAIVGGRYKGGDFRMLGGALASRGATVVANRHHGSLHRGREELCCSCRRSSSDGAPQCARG